jgi:hypothetical protein
MSTDRAEAAVETAIAEHVANAFRQTAGNGQADAIASRVRNRITERFAPSELRTEQDNQPPALVAFYRRIASAFAPVGREPETPERVSRLTGIKNSLATLRGSLPAMGQRSRLDHARAELLIERQQLVVKNELTEGFGRMEAWILSISFLTLVIFNGASILWAVPLLGLSIGRAWYLDRQCKRRRKTISEIDALIGRIERAGRSAVSASGLSQNGRCHRDVLNGQS